LFGDENVRIRTRRIELGPKKIDKGFHPKNPPKAGCHPDSFFSRNKKSARKKEEKAKNGQDRDDIFL
jgi:hypothetical protein